MSDLHDLIRACKSEPDDDAPRLVLADWLEEHGQPDRAEFIRRQIEGSGHAPAKPEWLGAWRGWAEAWYPQSKLESSNLGVVAEFPYPVAFRRGFIRVSDSYDELYKRLADILRPPYDWTWVEGIEFGSWHSGDWTPLIESPLFLELNSAFFDSDHYAPVLVDPLSKSPNVSHLKDLGLLMVHVLDEGVAKLSQATHLARLRSLEISFGGIGEGGSRAFARSEVWDLL
ncbi:MAG: TIGR02996 domain-containing protein, partial [Zavarzinella sp.]|nr:TIGR02996 domain-containing protein [Zavarzinella sp.]